MTLIIALCVIILIRSNYLNTKSNSRWRKIRAHVNYLDASKLRHRDSLIAVH